MIGILNRNEYSLEHVLSELTSAVGARGDAGGLPAKRRGLGAGGHTARGRLARWAEPSLLLLLLLLGLRCCCLLPAACCLLPACFLICALHQDGALLSPIFTALLSCSSHSRDSQSAVDLTSIGTIKHTCVHIGT